MRRAALLLLIAAVGAAPAAAEDRCTGPVRVETQLGADASLRLGEGIDFIGGAVLAGPCAEGFGGFSAMVADAGLVLTAASDRGNWLRARLSLDDGRIDLHDAALAPIAGGEADGTRGVCHGLEAEGLTRLGDTLLMTFDTSGIVLAFDAATLERRPPADRAPLPLLRPGGRGGTGGYEAIAMLPDGRPIVLREHETGHKPRRQNQFRPSPQRVWVEDAGRWVEQQTYRGPEQPRDANEFRISDAANLPDGGLLLLETSWTRGVGNHSRVLRARFQGDTLEAVGEALLSVDPGILSDNFEALAVARSAEHGTLLLMLSDDNLDRDCVRLPNQRTKLLVFRLGE